MILELIRIVNKQELVSVEDWEIISQFYGGRRQFRVSFLRIFLSNLDLVMTLLRLQLKLFDFSFCSLEENSHPELNETNLLCSLFVNTLHHTE